MKYCAKTVSYESHPKNTCARAVSHRSQPPNGCVRTVSYQSHPEKCVMRRQTDPTGRQMLPRSYRSYRSEIYRDLSVTCQTCALALALVRLSVSDVPGGRELSPQQVLEGFVVRAEEVSHRFHHLRCYLRIHTVFNKHILIARIISTQTSRTVYFILFPLTFCSLWECL